MIVTNYHGDEASLTKYTITSMRLRINKVPQIMATMMYVFSLLSLPEALDDHTDTYTRRV